MNPELTRKLEHSFATFDEDNDGFIELSDLEERSRRFAVRFNETDSPKGIAALEGMRAHWQALAELTDADADGRISKTEFVDAVGAALAESDSGFDRVFRPALSAGFALADTNDDGYIGVEEFVAFMYLAGFSLAKAPRLFAALDTNGDGKVTVDEWLTAFKAHYTQVTADLDLPVNAFFGST
ncbi:Ca2+-binding EF-hand superfamily protein [Crossiella equi]|uniref:Ca2+-binding EF-hand superfamily protein n=1 Tax=Crossiella equi TaxID=130796 RepID=A0ABS5AQD8_9PSEU|nr:EF-hand domain-containing protein [Crossiella equi]MBP2478781.1 Ca2+-binding EF-hand superfamily protein [Crossiella equi]